jgi:hypothetical protein
LHAVSQSESSIRLTWNALGAADSVERIRIYYRSGTALPLDYDFAALKLDSIVPEPRPGDTLAMASPLSANTRYYFGAQTYKKGMWSRLTAASCADDSTVVTASIKNTIKMSRPGYFDSATNQLWVYWTVDTTVGSNLKVGVSYSTMPGTQADSSVHQSMPAKAVDSVAVTLNEALLFNQDYYVALWLKRGSEPWVAPSTQSSAVIHVGAFVWQTVRYTVNRSKNDTTLWASGALRIITEPSSVLAGVYTGKIRPFTVDTAKLSGFIKVGSSVVFSEHDQTDSIGIGLKSGAIPSPYRLQDERLYRYDTSCGCWLVERESAFDTAGSYVYVKTNQLDQPFALMIDTAAPRLRLLSGFDSIVVKGAPVRDTVQVIDNVGNVQWRFRSAKGGAPYALGDTSQGRTLTNGKDTALLHMKVESDEVGARAVIVADDGRQSDSITLSRRVHRDTSDKLSTPELRWTPLRVTARLDSSSAKRLQRFINKDDATSGYDPRYLRLFRWLPAYSSRAVQDNWVEWAHDLDSNFAFECGRLLWIKTRAAMGLDFGSGATLPLDSTITVSLNPKGWTDFALPFRYTMRVGDIIAATRKTSSYADSLQFYQWLIQANSKAYSCAQFYLAQLSTGNDSLRDPTRVMSCQDDSAGFAVYNPSGDIVQMRIPPLSAALSTVAKSKRAAGKATAWSIRVTPRSGEGIALSAVYCGAEFGQGAGAQTRYFPLPPTLEGISVGVVEEKSGVVYGSKIAAGGAKEVTSRGGFSYLLTFRNDTKSAQSVKYSLERLGALPKEFSVALYNGMTGELTEATGGALSISLDAQGREYRYLIVGDAAYIAGAGKLLAGAKLAFERVYPNPLRGVAHLRYSVPFARVGRVEFMVLDISGRVVWRRTVVEKSAVGGSRECLWYGTTGGGKRVAAGVYIVKMTAFDLKEKRIAAFEQRLTALPR